MKQYLSMFCITILLVTTGCSSNTNPIDSASKSKSPKEKMTESNQPANLVKTAWDSLEPSEQNLVTTDYHNILVKKLVVDSSIQKTLDFYYKITSAIVKKYDRKTVYSISFPTNDTEIGTVTFYYSTYDHSFLGRVNRSN